MTSTASRVLPVAFISLMSACASAPVTSTAAAPASPAPAAAPTTSTELPPPVRSLEQLLAGRVSGASVTAAPLGGVIVRISGPHSFSLNQAPLYMVDGVPVEASTNGTLSWLNAEDIESITVLKYDAQTAMYGVRGANGVILIKTKGHT